MPQAQVGAISHLLSSGASARELRPSTIVRFASFVVSLILLRTGLTTLSLSLSLISPMSTCESYREKTLIHLCAALADNGPYFESCRKRENKNVAPKTTRIMFVFKQQSMHRPRGGAQGALAAQHEMTNLALWGLGFRHSTR